MIATDSLRIATAAGGDFTQHVYGLAATYDLSNRRTLLSHPAGTTQSTYEAVTGDLSTITDRNNTVYRYTYDAAGRTLSLLSREGRSDAVLETRGYDLDSRMTQRAVAKTSGGAAIHDDILTYDPRDKVVRAGLDTSTYDGRGRAVRTVFGAVQEQFTLDAFGNVTLKSGVQIAPSLIDYGYVAGTGRLRFQKSPGSQGLNDSTAFAFDPQGHLLTTTALAEAFGEQGSLPFPPVVTLRRLSEDQFDDRNKLVQHRFTYDTVQARVNSPNFNTFPSNVVKYITTETYRYDALGRRVWARNMRDTLCTRDASPERLTGCASTLTRTVWDGDDMLFEFRTDGSATASTSALESDANTGTYFDVVHYVHGQGIDAPLAALSLKGEVLPIAA